MISLTKMVEFLLENNVTPSKICLAMAEYYRAKAIEAPYKRTPYGQAPSGEPCTEAYRWTEIAMASDKCAGIFKSLNI